MSSIATREALAGVSAGYEDMARQHRAVRLEVVELRGMIDSCSAPQRTDSYRNMLAVLVGRLRQRLATHFELEQDNHLERLRRLRPECAPELDRFEREHGKFVAEASQLAELLRAPIAPPDTVGRTMQWLDALRQHENAEELFVGNART
ncbi:MAG: hemerythrin domain-containing protein [bacterium]